MYANTQFAKSVNEWGRVEEWIKPGEKISQSDLGVSDEEWESLIKSGSVVEEYPNDLDPGTPPSQYKKQSPELTELPPHASPAPNPPKEDSGSGEAKNEGAPKKQPWET